MSIDRETFENASEDELQEISLGDLVLGFLAANDDTAFKTSELATQLDLDQGGVSTALRRLQDRDLVEHKATYWAITSDEQRLQEYDGYARATALFNEQFESEAQDEWAVYSPDQPHPSIARENE